METTGEDTGGPGNEVAPGNDTTQVDPVKRSTQAKTRTAVVLSGPEARLAGQRGPFLEGDFQVFMVPSQMDMIALQKSSIFKK